MDRTSLLAFAATTLLAAGVASADIVRTEAGKDIEGTLELQAVQIRTESGTVEIPRDALHGVSRQGPGTRFDALLNDGTRYRGELLGLDSLRIKVGPVVQILPLADVAGFAIRPLGFGLTGMKGGFYRSDRPSP